VSVEGVGTVDLASGAYTANAAGVIVAPATTNTGNHPGQIDLAGNGLPFASVLIGNSSLGFFPLIPANASTGLGSSTPPTTIMVLNETLGSIFGASFTGITNGTVLELFVNDTPGLYFDNSGSFVISTVPEPPALVQAGMAVLVLLTFACCRRIKATA
jgi:hypothetical protein